MKVSFRTDLKAMYFLRYGADFFSIDLLYIIPVPTHCHLVAYLHSGSNSDCRHWIYQIQRYVRRGIYRCIDKVSVHTKHVVFVSEQKTQEYSKRKERKLENTDKNKKRR